MADEVSSPPNSDNPYIRTYAKDVAALTGKGPVVSGDSRPTLTPIAPPTVPAVLTPQADEPSEQERAEVLERLRARAAANPITEGELLPPAMPMPKPIFEPVNVPIPQAPTPAAPIPVVAPLESTPEQPIPAPPMESSAPVSIPIPVPIQAPEKDDSPLHTYSSDFSDRIDTREASAFSVLAAQSDEGKLTIPKQPTVKKGRGILIVVAGVLLLLVGGGGAVAAYLYVAQHASVPVVAGVPSLIFADDQQQVNGEGAGLMQALAASAGNALPDGKVRVLYLMAATTTSAKQIINAPLPGGQLIGALQLPAPDILLRNIAPDSTVGVVHAGSETRAFFIMDVLSYESTFAGMLTWERSMGSDLVLLYPAYPVPTIALPATLIATTTATSTSKTTNKKTTVATSTPIVVPVFVPPHFIDEVTSNHDVRALKDGQNRTILLYGYRDKNTLIIARDEAAFGLILDRLSTTKQQ